MLKIIIILLISVLIIRTVVKSRRGKTNSKPAHLQILPTPNLPKPVQPDWSKIGSKIEKFSGILNSLREVDRNFEKDFAEETFNDLSQIIEYIGQEDLKCWFGSLVENKVEWDALKYRNAASKILNELISVGIVPSTEKEIIWKNEYSARYRKLQDIVEGQVCEVLNPYWTYNNEIFEKGLVQLKK